MRRWKAGRGVVLLGMAVVACGETRSRLPGEDAGGQAGEKAGAGRGGDDDVPIVVADGGAGGGNAAGGDAGAGPTMSDAGEGNAGTPNTAPEHGAIDCDGNPIELDEARVHRCVMLTSCTGGRYSPDSSLRAQLGSCVTNGPTLQDAAWGGEPGHLPGPWSPTPWTNDARLEACGAALTSCDDVLACAGFRVPLGECDDGSLARCEGSLAINCGENALVVDCARTTGRAGSCQVVGDGAAARAECVVKPDCASDPAIALCDGDVLYRCQGGEGVGTDCSRFGQTCSEMAHTEPACAPVAPAVDCDWREFRCRGDLLTYCSEDQKRFTFDCAAGGDFICHEASQAPADPNLIGCHPANCEAGSYFQREDVCDGDVVVMALGNVGFDSPPEPAASRARVHCADYGFRTCSGGLCVN